MMERVIKVLNEYVENGEWKYLEEIANNSDLPEVIREEADKRILEAIEKIIEYFARERDFVVL